MSTARTFDLVTVGRYGFTGYRRSEPNAHTSGYDTEPDKLVARLADGGFIVDTREAVDRPGGVRAVLNAPLVALDLEEPERCPEPSDILLAGLEGSFRFLAGLRKTDSSFTGLDTVPLETFLDYWREHGARIGRRVGDGIQWESGPGSGGE